MSRLWSSAEALHIQKSQKPPCLIEDPWGRRFWIFSNGVFCCDFIPNFLTENLHSEPIRMQKFPWLSFKVIRMLSKRPVSKTFVVSFIWKKHCKNRVTWLSRYGRLHYNRFLRKMSLSNCNLGFSPRSILKRMWLLRSIHYISTVFSTRHIPSSVSTNVFLVIQLRGPSQADWENSPLNLGHRRAKS